MTIILIQQQRIQRFKKVLKKIGKGRIRTYDLTPREPIYS